MSTGISQAAVRNAWVWIAVGVFLPTWVRAGTSNAPPRPNANGVRRTNAPQPPRQSAPKPALRSGVRTPASFTPEMPLSEAIDILRTCTTPPLNIVVFWRDLENAGIYRDTTIGIDGIPGLRLRQYLDMLVLSLSAGAPNKIAYAVHHGVITIATTEALPVSRQMTRVYDITDLVSPPSMPFGPMGFGNMGYGNAGYGGGLGMGYGMGSSHMPGRYYGTGGAGSVPGLLGNTGSGAFRR